LIRQHALPAIYSPNRLIHLILVKAGNAIDIPKEATPRVENHMETETFVIIEVRRGDYFGEDGIVRLEDDFGR
jgi:mannose-6-phosphate isomerase-like protein (cupin superfamily)